MPSLRIELTEQMYDTLRKLCFDEHITMSELVRELLRSYIEPRTGLTMEAKIGPIGRLSGPRATYLNQSEPIRSTVTPVTVKPSSDLLRRFIDQPSWEPGELTINLVFERCYPGLPMIHYYDQIKDIVEKIGFQVNEDGTITKKGL